MKRKYTITITNAGGKETVHEMEAESMKTLDCAVVLMDWDEKGCRYNEVGFIRYEADDKVAVTSSPV